MRGVILGVPVANTPAIVTTAGTVLNANKKRAGFIIQNVGTNPIFLRFGADASATVFHLVLKGGTGDSDGNGGSYEHSGSFVYDGIVSIAGTTPKVVVTEF